MSGTNTTDPLEFLENNASGVEGKDDKSSIPPVDPDAILEGMDSDTDDGSFQIPDGADGDGAGTPVPKDDQKDSSKETPPKENPAEDKDAKIKSLEAQIAKFGQDLQEQKSLSEKQVNDAKRKMHEATTELARIRKSIDPDDADDFFNEGAEPKKGKPTIDVGAIKTEAAEEAASVARQTIFLEQEKVFKKDTPDYEAIVTEDAINEIATPGSLFNKKWVESTKTPEALYQIAKLVKDAKALFENPDEFKKRLMETAKQPEPEEGSGDAKPKLGRINSMTPMMGGDDSDTDDPLSFLDKK